MEVLASGDREKVVEVLDAIGFMTFYHQELVSTEAAQKIYQVMKDSEEDSLLQWKAILCLSAFPTQDCILWLERFMLETQSQGEVGYKIRNNTKDLLYQEAKRSLLLMKKNMVSYVWKGKS